MKQKMEHKLKFSSINQKRQSKFTNIVQAEAMDADERYKAAKRQQKDAWKTVQRNEQRTI